MRGARGRQARTSTLANVEARQARLRDLYELGDIKHDDYMRRRADLEREASAINSASEPMGSFTNEQRCARSSTTGGQMTSDQRKRLLGTIFEEITVGDAGVPELVPREGGLPYLRATLIAPRVLSERKTGLEPATPTLARLCSTN
jgi:hypothetical protein